MNLKNFDNEIPYQLKGQDDKKILTPELILIIIACIGVYFASRKGNKSWI